MKRLLLPLLAAAACAQPPQPQAPAAAAAPAGPKTTTARYAVELRQKVNTCGPIDPQTAFDTFAVWRTGDAALVVAGTDRVFAVRADDDGDAVALSGKIVEPEPAKAGGRAVVCKKNTLVDLQLKGELLTGSYTRENAQDCVAKGCSISFAVDGKRL